MKTESLSSSLNLKLIFMFESVRNKKTILTSSVYLFNKILKNPYLLGLYRVLDSAIIAFLNI